MSSKAPKVNLPAMPAPSAAAEAASQAQADALNTQTELLKKQLAMQDLLAPALYQAAGLSPKYDTNGKITGFEQTDNSKLQSQVQGLTLERELKALKGELPVDPQLTQELDRQEQQLRAQLQQNLGNGYEVSTPGIQALGDFNQRKANILTSAARGEITALAPVAASNANTVDASIQAALGISNPTLQGISLFSPNAAGYGSIVSNDNQMRQTVYNAQSQAAITNAQLKAQANSSLMSGIGSLFGMGMSAFGYGGAFGQGGAFGAKI